jgi:hypothetical protein
VGRSPAKSKRLISFFKSIDRDSVYALIMFDRLI